jgi:hypothetical protein
MLFGDMMRKVSLWKKGLLLFFSVTFLTLGFMLNTPFYFGISIACYVVGTATGLIFCVGIPIYESRDD